MSKTHMKKVFRLEAEKHVLETRHKAELDALHGQLAGLKEQANLATALHRTSLQDLQSQVNAAKREVTKLQNELRRKDSQVGELKAKARTMKTYARQAERKLLLVLATAYPGFEAEQAWTLDDFRHALKNHVTPPVGRVIRPND